MPPHIESARDLLLDRLGTLLTAEEVLARRVLPSLTRQIQDDELKTAVTEHLEQTRGHVRRLRDAFGALGEAPAGRPAPGLDGLVLERESNVKNIVPALRGTFDCVAAAGVERYEINGYEAAVALAMALGEARVVEQLQANLDEERAALEKLRGHAERLAPLAVEQ